MERFFWEFGRNACLIHDRLQGSWSNGHERYIGTARDADIAQRMVDLLNANEAAKQPILAPCRSRVTAGDIFA